METKYLREQCGNILARYYEKKGHQKKAIQSGGGYQEMKRDIQARFIPESFGDETFLSEEVAINILQETKQAFQRCQTVRTAFAFLSLLIGYSIFLQLSGPAQTSANIEQILDILLHYLCVEHIDYAVELALYGK